MKNNHPFFNEILMRKKIFLYTINVSEGKI